MTSAHERVLGEPASGFTPKRMVVVHRGARDAYEVSRALSEAGLLQALVTDLYWPADKWLARLAAGIVPPRIGHMLLARNNAGLPSAQVTQLNGSGLASFLLEKLPRISFAWKQRATRWTDARLGKRAGELAKQTQAALLSYSYYAFDSFRTAMPGLLFQLHPHPASVRAILQRELLAHPDCATSLNKEWELSLPASDLARLNAETHMAAGFIAASSFTKRTLVENGADPKLIEVVPYGVNLERFRPSARALRHINDPLRLLFVGTINQRKGIKYLVEALQLLRTRRVELTVCGRVVDDLAVFKPLGAQVNVRPSVSLPELIAAYQAADLFVLPSVAEGFGQVLLEALASGLPILSTTATAAPDLIQDRVHGFVVPPCRPDLLAERFDWALDNRMDLADMGQSALKRAQHFTWERFRKGIIQSVLAFQSRP